MFFPEVIGNNRKTFLKYKNFLTFFVVVKYRIMRYNVIAYANNDYCKEHRTVLTLAAPVQKGLIVYV